MSAQTGTLHEETTPSTVDINGWAWSTAPVDSVVITIDDLLVPAELEPRDRDHITWQRFTLQRVLEPGPHRIAAHARDTDGRTQPKTGERNAAHDIVIVCTP